MCINFRIPKYKFWLNSSYIKHTYLLIWIIYLQITRLMSNRDSHLTVRPYSDEDCVILDISSFHQHVLVHKPWKSKSQLIWVITGRRSVEVGPVRVRYEGLHDVNRCCSFCCLIQQGEGDCVSEGPLQDTIIGSRQQFYVKGDMSILPSTIAIEKEGSLESITRVGRKERMGHQFKPSSSFRFRHLLRKIWDLSYEDTIFDNFCFFYLCF